MALLGTLGGVGGAIGGLVLTHGDPTGAVAGYGVGSALGNSVGGGGQQALTKGNPEFNPIDQNQFYVPGLPTLANQYGTRATPMVSEGAYGAPTLGYTPVNPIPYGASQPSGMQAYLANQNAVRMAANRLPPPGPSAQNPGGYQLGGLNRFQSQTPVTAQNYQQYQNQLAAAPGQAPVKFAAKPRFPGNPWGPQAAQPGQPAGQNPSFRNYQEQLSGDLLAQARGQAPSLAEQMYRNAADRNMRQQLSLAAGARGNQNLALRNAQINASQYQSDTAGALAAARLAERQQAQGLLGQVAGQGRGMDIGVAQGNQDAALRQQALNQQGQLDALRLQQQGLLAYQDARTARAVGQVTGASNADKLLTGGANLADIYLKTRQNNPVQPGVPVANSVQTNLDIGAIGNPYMPGYQPGY